MASDFGDESGEKLFDWMLRVGQDAGQQAMLDTADRLATAFRNAREGLGGKAAEEGGAVSEWAKLDMKEFAELPDYESLKQIIGERLADRGITHMFETYDGQSVLMFQIKDVHEVSDIFHRLEDATREAAAHAKDANLEKDRDIDRDSEPLEQRAAAARSASKALDAARGADREIELSPTLGK